jgi:phage FluMu protein Com
MGMTEGVENEIHETQHEYKVRCDQCNRLLGAFEMAKGEIKCPRCKHVQRIEIEERHRRSAA